jgi:hypothetical protein
MVGALSNGQVGRKSERVVRDGGMPFDRKFDASSLHFLSESEMVRDETESHEDGPDFGLKPSIARTRF